MNQPTAPISAPPSIGNKIGALANVIFKARTATEFAAALEEFRAEHRDHVLTEAAALVAGDTDHITYGSATDYANRHRDLILAARTNQGA